MKTVLEFIIVGVLLRGIVARWLGEEISRYIIWPFCRFVKRTIVDPSIRWLKARLIKSQADMARYIHSQNKRLNKGHQHKFDTCKDGQCAMI